MVEVPTVLLHVELQPIDGATLYLANKLTYSTAYLTVILVQTNVYKVSNIAARVACPVVRRLQLFSIPQLHRPGKTRQLVTQTGA